MVSKDFKPRAFFHLKFSNPQKYHNTFDHAFNGENYIGTQSYQACKEITCWICQAFCICEMILMVLSFNLFNMVYRD